MNKISKSAFIKLPLYLAIIVGLVFGLNYLFSPNSKFLPGIRIIKAGDSQNLCGWAWSENIGWVSFNSNDCDTNGDGVTEGTVGGLGCPEGASTSNYGAHIDPSGGELSGYGWSENIGWLSFNRSETGAPPPDDPCPSGNCIAKVVPAGQFRKSDVNIEGWARALAACDSVPCPSSGAGANTGGWDGWLRFDHGQAGEAIFKAGEGEDKFHNWAWDNDNSRDTTATTGIGWLSLNSEEGGGLIDYAVGYNCKCTDWANQGCGEGSCKKNEMKQTRSCTPSGCFDESQCIDSPTCYHKECKNNQCVSVAGTGTSQCATTNDCLLKPWLNWKWWEIVPKLNK